MDVSILVGIQKYKDNITGEHLHHLDFTATIVDEIKLNAPLLKMLIFD
jgi:hypothetical protein